jgi:hypothetical protein
MKKLMTLGLLGLNFGCFGAWFGGKDTCDSVFFEGLILGVFHVVILATIILTGMLILAAVIKKAPILGISIIIAIMIFGIFFGTSTAYVP